MRVKTRLPPPLLVPARQQPRARQFVSSQSPAAADDTLHHTQALAVDDGRELQQQAWFRGATWCDAV